MGRKQQSGFGVVARTGVSLLALGFGSALFGAMIVGPRLGGILNRDSVSAESRLPAVETRLASANVNDEDDPAPREPAASEPARTAVEPVEEPTALVETSEEETENPDLIQYAEGTGPATTMTPEQLGTVDPDQSRPTESATPEAVKPEPPSREKAKRPESETTPASRRATETRVERTTEPEKPATRTRKPEAAEPGQSESRKSRPARATEAPKVEPETRKRERAKPVTEKRSTDRVASVKVETDKRKPERVESSKPSASRATATADAAPAPEGKLFRVRVGRVTSREDAEKLRDELRDNVGVDAFLVRSGDGFRVQTGAYRARENAEKIAAELRAGSFRPEVTED